MPLRIPQAPLPSHLTKPVLSPASLAGENGPSVRAVERGADKFVVGKLWTWLTER
jgi:hypothetical protein